MTKRYTLHKTYNTSISIKAASAGAELLMELRVIACRDIVANSNDFMADLCKASAICRVE